jgi:subfamily B ATP-binding cassette protein MsbA
VRTSSSLIQWAFWKAQAQIGVVVPQIVQHYRWHMVFAAVAGIVVAAATGAISGILKPAIDQLFGDHPPPLAWVYFPIAIVALAIIRAVGGVSQVWTTNTVGHKVVGTMQADLFDSLIRSDLATLRSRHSGSIVSAMLYDASMVRTAATSSIINYMRESLILISQLVVMMINDWSLTLGVLLTGPVAMFLIQRFSRWVRPRKAPWRRPPALSTAVMEGLDGVKIVKIENREAYEEAAWPRWSARRQATSDQGRQRPRAAAPATEMVMTLITAGVIAYAGWRALNGAFGRQSDRRSWPPLGMASQSLRQVANLQTVLGEGLAAAERLFEAMDIEARDRTRPAPPP